MNKLLTTNLRWLLMSLLLTTGVGSAWGQTVLFHETFGDNSGSARAWNDSYSVKSGVSDVYAGITGYTITNAKQSKNTMGATASGLTQSSQGTDASIIIGPLNVANYETLQLTYQWKAASIKGTYSTSAYYATSSTGTYSELTGTGTGATTFVERSYSLPAAAQVATLYIKIVWNTSNTQAIIDEVELTGTASGPSTTATTTSFPQASYLTSYPGTFSAPTATVKAGTTTVTSPAVTYSSSDESVATVNANTGAVTLVGIGSTTITANYAGNNTYSSSSGSYTLTVEDGRPTTTTSFPESSYEAIKGESFSSPTATVKSGEVALSNPTITYSSSNTAVATVVENTGAVTIIGVGETTITATFAATSSYQGSHGSYTLTVSNAGGTASTVTYDFAGTNDYGSGVEKTNSGSYVTESKTWTSGIATLTTVGKYRWWSNDGTLRFYANDNPASAFTIAVPSGYAMTNITFSCNAGKSVSSAGNGNFSNNTWTGSTQSVTFTAGTAQIKTITITYVVTGSDNVSDPTITESFTFWPATTEAPSRTIKITPTTTGSSIRYTTDGTTPSASNGYTSTSEKELTITGTTTVKAYAYIGSTTSEVVSATYTLGQTVNSIAAFKDLTTGTEARLYLSPEQNARVLHYSGNEIYLRDNTGAICLYLNSSLQKTIPAHDYHVAGWIIGEYQPYNNLPELVATSNTTTAYLAFAAPVTEEATSPVAISADDFDNYKADWVTITDLRAESNNNVTDDAGNTFKVYNKYGLNADSYYQDLYDYALVDLTGLAIPYNTDKEIVPIYYNDARPIVYVIDENKEFQSPNSNIQNATVRLVRTLSATNWNTFVIPIYLPSFPGSIRRYDHADGTTMVFADDSQIEAGKPYLVKPDERIENPVYTNVTLSSTPAQNVEQGGYSFNAIYGRTNIYTDDKTHRFLKSDGYLYWPTDEEAGYLKGMRAYFVVPASATNVKVNPDGTATAIDDLIIMNDLRDNKVYDVSGRMVSNDLRSLPRGIYIVNGKKIVVR